MLTQARERLAQQSIEIELGEPVIGCFTGAVTITHLAQHQQSQFSGKGGRLHQES
jgi:hypothetical protein